MIYITDGSFEGILTAVFEAYMNKEEPEAIVTGGEYQVPMDMEIREIATDAEKSDRVWRGVKSKISDECLEQLYRAYLSEHPQCGLYIYRYIKIGLKLGFRVAGFLQHPDVLAVHDLDYKVNAEIHLFLGILRFKKLKSGIFYACYEPDNNITQLITDHFAKRLQDQAWIIHDKKRDIFAVYNGEEVLFTSGLPSFADEAYDLEFEMLWKRYFDTIAIESRKNPKLQRSFLPARYWKHLVEKQPYSKTASEKH